MHVQGSDRLVFTTMMLHLTKGGAKEQNTAGFLLCCIKKGNKDKKVNIVLSQAAHTHPPVLIFMNHS